MAGAIYVDVGDVRSTDPMPTGEWGLSVWGGPTALWSGVVPSWTPIECRVRHVSIAGGRAGALDVFTPTIANIDVENSDGWATWSPAAPLPVTAGSWLRVRCDDSTLFLGTVARIADNYQPGARPGAVLVCVDLLARLARITLTARTPGWAGDTVAQRITHLLDAVDWPAELRDLDAGGPPLTATAAEGNVLDLVQRAAASDGGCVFADVDGRICYRGPGWLRTAARSKAPQAVVANTGAPGSLCAVAMSPAGPDVERVVNIVTIAGVDEATTPPTKVVVTRTDEASRSRYGDSTWPTGELSQVDPAQLDVLATRVLGMRALPVPRLDTLDLDPIADPPVPYTGPRNLLPENMCSFENGTVTGVGVASGTGVASQARAAAGTWALQVTKTAAATPYTVYGSGGMGAPVLVAPGRQYTLMASMWTADAGSVNLGVQWFDITGAGIGGVSWGPTFPIVPNTWQQHRRMTVAAPAGAARLLLFTNFALATVGAVVWVDRLGVFAGDVASDAWVLPSYTGTPGSLDYVKAARFGDRVHTSYVDPEGWGWAFQSHVHTIAHDIAPAGADRQAAEWTCSLTLDDAAFWTVADAWGYGLWGTAKWAGSLRSDREVPQWA